MKQHENGAFCASDAPTTGTPGATTRLGMVWWSRLSKYDRRRWLARAGSARPVDA